MVTKKVKLGTSVLSVFVRSPPTLALGAANVDLISEGRFILGVGSSHKVQVEGQHGLKYEKPLARVRETVEIIRTLFRDGRVSLHGEVFDLDGFRFSCPLFRRNIPIYGAGVNPKMLELCGEIGDGNIGLLQTVEKTRGVVSHIHAGRRKASRPLATFEIAAILPCVVNTDSAQAKQKMRKFLVDVTGRYPRYNKLLADAGFPEEAREIRAAWLRKDVAGAMNAVSESAVDCLTVAGTPEECDQRLAEYREAGLTLPILLAADADEKIGITDIVRLLG
jgi:alkanesulfonate monooxygenase SsuD/methylene tetrahydromethanopterin reductase-like flavin-dependent oxidoreductase (luciferase family)